ncbi:cation/H(+) antiporter 4-like [Prunus avium]|uniref:Cation/H(+) antiporter 4-like n=1 Tax=Prunus avium TaxID=42229 RepID=A0A6P5U3X8_PRUAV|nr:cation/H(+) antiporter 4-like [Prunus avium]
MEFGGNWDDVFKSPAPLVRASHLVPLLELQIVVIFVITQVTHHLFFKRFKLPKVISQIVTGILLGPSIKDKSGKESLFPLLSQDVIGMASVFGYAFFMFLTGVKMDVGMIKKTGHKALTIGILSLVVPIVCGLLTTFACTYVFKEEEDDKVYFVAVTHSLTSFAVVSSLLQDLKLLNSELGRLGLSSGLVSDMINVITTSTASFIRAFMGTGQPTYKIYRDIGSLIAYILAVVFIIRPALFWIVKHTPAGRPVKDAYIYAIFLMVLLSGVLSDMFNQTALLGPFILGLAVPDGPPLGAAIVKKFDCFFSGVFTPLFVTICAMKADLSSIGDDRKLLTLDIVLLVVTFVSKVMASFVPSLICKMPFNDALAIGFIMSSKGIVELASYSLFHDYKTIDDQTFAVLLVSVLIIAILVPSMVNYLYDPSSKYAGYQKRNIIDMKPNAELRILACIHSQYDVAPVINLLDVSCPTGGSPISVNALHLIELVGRASPVFIAHQIHEKVTFNIHFSEKVIGPFNQYQLNNQGAVSANIFTAISPSNLMHEDICTLALDKLTSIILLPFHRKFAFDGSIESEGNARRALNCSVLERAPCSIGIIVHRGHLRHSSQLYRVAMIFLGGRDDREALTFAKRVTKDPGSFSLTVVRLDAEDGKTMNDWEKVLDNEVLKEFKQKSVANAHVTYVEETAKDAVQTTRILRSIMNEFELIIVGRRNGLDSPQTLGFSEWSEFPELGVIGDLLVSSDFDCNASIFVVQQQQQLKGSKGFKL